MAEINNSGPNLDESEIKKEARRLAREERRRQKEETAEQAMSNAPKNSRPKMSYEDKKKIKLYGVIGAAFILLLIIVVPVVKFINNNGNPNQPTGLLLLTDMTGYTEEDAIDKMHEIGFINIKREYIFDQFTLDKCVIKTNYHINSELRPDEEIIVYICDKSLIQLSEEEQNSNSQGMDRTFFTMDGITVVDMAIKDNVFYAILKNNNSQAIRNIQYRIGYQNIDGTDIGENKYALDSEFTVLPGEKFKISMDIRNSYAYYLYVSGLTYERVTVPESERN